MRCECAYAYAYALDCNQLLYDLNGSLILFTPFTQCDVHFLCNDSI